MNQSDDHSPFTDLDTKINDAPIALSAHDRYVIARARLIEAVHYLVVASIYGSSNSYSKALDKVACASAQEVEAFQELRHFF